MYNHYVGEGMHQDIWNATLNGIEEAHSTKVVVAALFRNDELQRRTTKNIKYAPFKNSDLEL